MMETRKVGETIDGKRIGLWTIWYDGDLGGRKSEGYFDENNKKTGVWIDTYYLSDRRYETGYLDGQPCGGLQLTWKNSTNVLVREEYRNGQGELEGLYREWYPDNGINRLHGYYKENRRHGTWKEWYVTGAQMSETTYREGSRIGLERRWYENGQMEFESNYVYDPNSPYYETLHGVFSRWYPGGERLSEESFQAGMRNGRCVYWFRNGQVDEDCWYVANARQGLFVSYYESGCIQSKGQYEDDDPVGEWEFYSDGSSEPYVRMNLNRGDDLSVFSMCVSGEYRQIITPVVPEVSATDKISRPTIHPCIVYKELPAPGSLYLLCQFSEEHVHDYNFMVTFARTTDLKRFHCLYCRHPVHETVYQQP